uniref:CSON015414 protein n=1 Tax=Culicoides sonorensis TaxID=179676 RepID=A0A336LTY4_CULSO
METSSSKDIYKSIFSIVKSLDEQKQKVHDVRDLFTEELQQKRRNVVEMCQILVLMDFDIKNGLGKKAREILWRKAYYDFISLAKHIFSKNKNNEGMSSVEGLIHEGILVFKTIILKLEQEFALDLKDTVDMTIIKDSEIIKLDIKQENEHHTMSEISYAWDVIHASLISIGDLYRYLLGFKSSCETINEKLVATYYEQAFKLNPTMGMSQNQLGTLYAGKNYEIDSIFHYLLALLCKCPFELSESNVNKIFQRNAIFLESNELHASLTDAETKVKYFVARFILVVDIFFYDKEVTDFTDLCHSFLIDLKYFLDESYQGFFTEDILFKMTSILLFCLHKIKIMGSKKVHSMNAVLVALASELVDKCNMSVVQFLSTKEAQNIVFHDKYNRIMKKFENYVRDDKRNKREKKEEIHPIIMGHTNKIEESFDGLDFNDDTLKVKKDDQPIKKLAKQRRRKRPQLSNCSDTEMSDMEESGNHNTDESDSDSESFSSYNDDSDESSSESDWSEENEDQPNSKFDQDTADSDSGEDIIVLAEEIIYPNGDDDDNNENHRDVFKSDEFTVREEDILKDLVTKFEDLSGVKYRGAYHKVDPNIIIEFCANEKCLKALKVLFDWMYLNPDIVVGCYVSNPEFIHKIMRLINYLNIDIFTRKIYFDRSFITTNNMRTDLRYLFDIRRTIPIFEDELLKKFSMFESLQQSIDWELSSKLKITKNETVFLRLFKLIDYGFHLTKMRKFHYYFCAKDRVFIERDRTRSGDRGKRRFRNRNGFDSRHDRERNSYEKNKRRHARDQKNRRGWKNHLHYEQENEDEKTNSSKRYIRKKIIQNPKNGTATTCVLNINNDFEVKSTSEKMAALWLHNEVSSLESKMKVEKNTNVILTPYIVVDIKALTEYTAIVKNLSKSKKFVILVPLGVLSELDELKKSSEKARNVIKWLEQEFTKGNRFIRSQRQHEALPLSMIQIPKKLDRESNTFFQIVKFCNYIVTNNQEKDSTDMITFLTGDNMAEKKSEGFSFQGILDLIPVKYEQIINFYSKYKKK